MTTHAHATVTFMPLGAEQAHERLPELIALLQDAVNGGASVGFLPPLADDVAGAFWRSVLADLGAQKRVLVAAMDAGRIVGSVQLELIAKPNAPHRAEVQKLLVLRSHRRLGIGQRLMEQIERQACLMGRRLLVLDTFQGSDADRLYRRLGFQEAGAIPQYSLNGQGSFDATVIFYKFVDEGMPEAVSGA
jgi:acetyltransferase